jgi:hypothetical protein
MRITLSYNEASAIAYLVEGELGFTTNPELREYGERALRRILAKLPPEYHQ